MRARNSNKQAPRKAQRPHNDDEPVQLFHISKAELFGQGAAQGVDWPEQWVGSSFTAASGASGKGISTEGSVAGSHQGQQTGKGGAPKDAGVA